MRLLNFVFSYENVEITRLVEVMGLEREKSLTLE